MSKERMNRLRVSLLHLCQQAANERLQNKCNYPKRPDQQHWQPNKRAQNKCAHTHAQTHTHTHTHTTQRHTHTHSLTHTHTHPLSHVHTQPRRTIFPFLDRLLHNTSARARTHSHT